MTDLLEDPDLETSDPDLEVSLPPIVEQKIGLEAWSALSWALHNGWVKDYKWYFSQMIHRDLGTPFTVRLMLYLENRFVLPIRNYDFFNEIENVNEGNLTTRGLLLFGDRVDPKILMDFYQLLVEGYLLGTDFVSLLEPVADEHGDNQLTGELKRYWAKTTGAQPNEVILDKLIIGAYCDYYELGTLAYRLAQKLGMEI